MNAQCLNYNILSNNCNFCSYNYFDSLIDQHYFQNLSIPIDQCIPKVTSFCSRKVLILNNMFEIQSPEFDISYNSLIQSFYSETLKISYCNASKIIFFLSKGNHFILKTQLNSTNNYFFRRINVDITIKPLLCSEYNLVNICNIQENPIIYIKSGLFSLIIANRLEIINIEFDAIDTNYHNIDNETCLNDINVFCCDIEKTLKNQSNPCFIMYENMKILSEENEYYGIFQLEYIFDDPDAKTPILILSNASFMNFYLIKTTNFYFSTIISIDYFGGNVILTNITFINGFLTNLIVFNDTNSLKKKYYNFNNFTNFFDFFNRNYDESYNEININGLYLKKMNEFSQFSNFQMGGLMFFDNFHGNIVIKNIIISEYISIQNIYVLYLINNNSTYSYIFSNFSIQNSSNLLLFFFENLDIFINTCFIYNFTWKDEFFIFFTNSYINFIDMVIINGSCADFSLNDMFTGLNSQIYFENILFLQLFSMPLSFNYSLLLINQTYFANIFMLNTAIKLFNTSLIIWNTQFMNITDFEGIFEFIYSFHIEIISNTMINLNGNCIYGGISFDSLEISNSTFINLYNLHYFINKIICKSVTFLTSKLINITVTVGLLYLLTPQNKDISGLYIYSSQFSNISLITLTTTNFMHIQRGIEIIENSSFFTILFYAAGIAIMNFQISKVFLKNNVFYNVGFAYPIDIRNFASVEYVVIFFLWSCIDISFYNNSFLNQGSINLFSGFIYTTLTTEKVIIDGNIFKYLNKSQNTFYGGLIILNTPILQLTNNKFHDIQCSNYHSFLHNNGAVSLQGDSSYMPIYSGISCFIGNNLFFDCQCQSGGSLGVINYANIQIINLYVYNSSALIAGGLLMVSSLNATLQGIYINYTKSYEAHTMYLKNIDRLVFRNMTISNGFSEKKGGFKIRDISYFYINFMIICNVSTEDIGGAFNLKIFSIISFKNSVFYLCKAKQYGGVAYLDGNGYFSLDNCVVIHGYSKFGGAFFFETVKIVNISKNIFNRTYSELQGSSLYVNLVSNFYLNSTTFLSCQSMASGIIYLKNEEIFANYYIYNLTCMFNKVKTGSCFFADTQGKIEINKVFFEYNENPEFYFFSQSNLTVILNNGIIVNSSTDYILYASNVVFHMKDIIFFNNIIVITGILVENSLFFSVKNLTFLPNKNLNNIDSIPFFECISTKLKISNILLSDNDNNFPQKIYLINAIKSDIFIFSCFIIRIFHYNEALISIDEGSIVFNDLHFIETEAYILISIDADVTIMDSEFKNTIIDTKSSILTDLYAESNFMSNLTIMIKNTNFTVISNIFSIYINLFSIIIIDKSYFQGNTNSTCIVILNATYILINNSLFKEFMLPYDGGGAVYSYSRLSLPTQIFINNSIFFNNSACFGGAFYFRGYFHMTLKNSSFIKNSAFYYYGDDRCGIAGVSLLLPLIDTTIDCIGVIESNIFQDNYADFMIATIYSKGFVNAMDNTFINNIEKSDISEKISSFPLFLKINDNNPVIIASGQPTTIIFILQDIFNQTMIFKNNITGNMMKTLNSTILTLKNTNSLLTNIGIFNFSNIIITNTPNTFFNFEIRVTTYDDISLKKVVFSSTFQFFSRPCKIGEIKTFDEKCQFCSSNYYSLIDPMLIKGLQSCKKCNFQQAFCPGGSYFIPLPGYWRNTFESEIIIACKISEACTGPPDISLKYLILNYDNYTKTSDFISGTCLQGHFGVLCDNCIKDYGKDSANNICTPCELMMEGIYLKMLFIFLFSVVYAMISAVKLSRNRDNMFNFSAVIKICLNHIQKIMIISTFDRQFLVNQIQGFFNFLNILSFTNEENVASDCFLKVFWTDFDNFYLYKVYATMIFPITVSSFGFFLLMIFECYIILRKKEQFITFQKISLLFLISIFLYYPLVTKCSLSLVNCVRLDDSNDMYLYPSPNIMCWQGIHKKTLAIIGFLGIFLWGILFPMTLVLLIKRNIIINEKNIMRVAIDYDIDSANTLCTSPRRRIMPLNSMKAAIHKKSSLYFFYKDYKNERYYWESVLFLYKFSLSLLPNIKSVFNDDKIDFLFLIIVLIYLNFFIQMSPFKTNNLNLLEFTSTIITVISRFIVVVVSFYSTKILENFVSYLYLCLNVIFFLFAFCIVVQDNDWKIIYLNFKEKFKHFKEKLSSDKARIHSKPRKSNKKQEDEVEINKIFQRNNENVENFK